MNAYKWTQLKDNKSLIVFYEIINKNVFNAKLIMLFLKKALIILNVISFKGVWNY